MLCRIAFEVGMLFGCCFEPVNEGAIIVTPFGCKLTPIGQALALCRVHQGFDRLARTASGPDGSIGWIAAEDQKSRTRQVTRINCSLQDACRIRLEIPDARTAGAKTVEVVVPACSVAQLSIPKS